MTVVIGIRTNRGLDHIVLASDRQLSEDNEDEDKTKLKRPIRKIYSGTHWVMGDAGGDDYDVRKFYRTLDSRSNGHNRTVRWAVRKKTFNEVLELNRRLMLKPEKTFEDTHAFILATNKPFSLWAVDEYGNLKDTPTDSDFDYMCIGSGKVAVKDHFRQQLAEEQFDRDAITTEAAIKLAIGGVYAASNIEGVGLGYDLFVVSPTRIIDWGQKIRRTIKRAEKTSIADLLKHYRA